jgi:hypothetical protein
MKTKRTPRKKTCIWFLAAAFLASATWSQAQTAGVTEKAVAALEQQWLHGPKANNPDLIAPLLADKIVVTEADGKVLDKAGMLAFCKKTKWDSAEYTDAKVTVFATPPSRPEAPKGSDAAGKPLDNNDRWTDTWTKMPSGRWQCWPACIAGKSVSSLRHLIELGRQQPGRPSLYSSVRFPARSSEPSFCLIGRAGRRSCVF